MALGACRLVGTVTLNGAPVAATIAATALLPSGDAPSGYLIPANKSITVPSTGVIPATPTLDVPGEAMTWPSKVRYQIVVTASGQTKTYETLVERGETAFNLGLVQFTVTPEIPDAVQAELDALDVRITALEAA